MTSNPPEWTASFAGFPPSFFGRMALKCCKIMPQRVTWVRARCFFPNSSGVILCPCWPQAAMPWDQSPDPTMPITKVTLYSEGFRVRRGGRRGWFYSGQCERCGTLYVSLLIFGRNLASAAKPH